MALQQCVATVTTMSHTGQRMATQPCSDLDDEGHADVSSPYHDGSSHQIRQVDRRSSIVGRPT